MKSVVIKLVLLALLWSPTAAEAADKPKERLPLESAAAKEEIVRVTAEADNRFSEGEYDSAEVLYKRLTIIAPKNREGYLGLGRIELLHGDREKALVHFRKAVSVSPQSAPAHFELGSTLLSMGKLKEALKELTSADKLSPQRPEIQYRLSQVRALVEASGRTSKPGIVKLPGSWSDFRLGGAARYQRGERANETDQKNSGPSATQSGTPGSSSESVTVTGSATVAPGTPTTKPETNSRPPISFELPKNAQNSLKDPTTLPTGIDSLDIDQSSEVTLVYRLLTSGRVEETMAQGLQALKQQPDNASLRYQIGLMHKVKGDVDKAIETFEEALKYDPQHAQSMAQLTQLFISRNELSKAKAAATRWVEADPDNPNAQFSVAWTEIVERKYKDALPHMRAAAQLDPRNTDLLNQLGLVLRELGDDQEASVYFQRALELAPSLPAPRLNLALIALYDQRIPEARELIKPLFASPVVTPHVQSVDALIDARDGLYDEAQRKASAVLKTYSRSPMSTLALAIVAKEKGRPDEAAALLEPLHRNNSRNVLLVHGLAEVYLAQHKTDKAIEFAKIAHNRSPNKFLIAKTLALALAKSNNTVGALEIVKQMRDRGDDPDKLFLLESTILDAANDRDGALKHYLALAAKQPENNDVAMKIAHLYFINRRLKDAELLVDGILTRDPDENHARLLKATILYDLRDYKGSLRQVQMVTADEDLDFETTCLTARASFKLKRYAEAAQLFKLARKKQPLNTDDLVMLARALRETDEADEIQPQVQSVQFSKSKRNPS